MFRMLSIEEKNPTRVGLITILNNSTASSTHSKSQNRTLAPLCSSPDTLAHSHSPRAILYSTHEHAHWQFHLNECTLRAFYADKRSRAEATKSSLRWVQRPTSSATLRNAINTPKGVGLKQFQRFFSTPFFLSSSQLHMGVSVCVRVRGVADRTDRPGTTSIRAC